jgi:lambda repressor-like predicted transcriptional regulator
VKKDPPIDWLKAAILERMSALGFTREDVSTLAGISAGTFRVMMAKPPAEWEHRQRCAVLSALHLRISDMPEDVQINIAQQLG